MNILVIGSGGREHALAWKINQSSHCRELFCLPGNPGTSQFATNIDCSVNDFEAIKKTILERKISMVVVGPEEPLVKGLRDYLLSFKELKNLLIVGPSALGAKLEGSKEYAKQFMLNHNIPTARYASFSKDNIQEAKMFLRTLEPPYVIKADGLAAGKGVLILEDLESAEGELDEIFTGKFGAAGDKVVIEEFLCGIEISFFVLTDGKDYILLPHAKDYKRIGENDTGLNTGGMGAISPLPLVTKEIEQKVIDKIIAPTIKGLAEEKIDYKGFIFFGLMICGSEPYLIEYNVRMGDPETEAVMTRIDSDFAMHLKACAEGNIKSENVVISDRFALTVVCVSEGYPQSYKKGEVISLPNSLLNSSDTVLFHCGTKCNNGILQTNGGRVLALTTNLAPNNKSELSAIELERELLYSQLDTISYSGKYFRKDIGLDVINWIENNLNNEGRVV